MDGRGDFNIVLNEEEKIVVSFNQSSMRALREFILNIGLVDLPLIGSKFTWSNFRENTTLCRLDRVLISLKILHMALGTCLHSLPKLIFDHNPLFLTAENFKAGPRPFKLFNHWVDNVDFLFHGVQFSKRVLWSGNWFVA
ncbi:hypothetical protein HRI_002692300 [Hibiscus trionum]|uniref:Reverse transcriptase n=1 Tax=Hibiscus trionum TaxID=183268 RepID=A0A9W7M9D1_HIBTR|nr:hypothetical protein HRI_002692300 [Hibiscus trionum]